LARGEPLIPFPIGFDLSDFGALLMRLDDCSRGVGIPEGFVAHSTFWLVRNGTEVVGVSSLRHSLTPMLLREEEISAMGSAPAPGDRDSEPRSWRRTLERAVAIG
jgi:predicted acetyltransferase